MPIYKTEDGTVYNVSEENIDKFVQENPSATDVSALPYDAASVGIDQTYSSVVEPAPVQVSQDVQQEELSSLDIAGGSFEPSYSFDPELTKKTEKKKEREDEKKEWEEENKTKLEDLEAKYKKLSVDYGGDGDEIVEQVYGDYLNEKKDLSYEQSVQNRLNNIGVQAEVNDTYLKIKEKYESGEISDVEAAMNLKDLGFEDTELYAKVKKGKLTKEELAVQDIPTYKMDDQDYVGGSPMADLFSYATEAASPDYIEGDAKTDEMDPLRRFTAVVRPDGQLVNWANYNSGDPVVGQEASDILEKFPGSYLIDSPQALEQFAEANNLSTKEAIKQIEDNAKSFDLHQKLTQQEYWDNAGLSKEDAKAISMTIGGEEELARTRLESGLSSKRPKLTAAENEQYELEKNIFNELISGRIATAVEELPKTIETGEYRNYLSDLFSNFSNEEIGKAKVKAKDITDLGISEWSIDEFEKEDIIEEKLVGVGETITELKDYFKVEDSQSEVQQYLYKQINKGLDKAQGWTEEKIKEFAPTDQELAEAMVQIQKASLTRGTTEEEMKALWNNYNGMWEAWNKNGVDKLYDVNTGKYLFKTEASEEVKKDNKLIDAGAVELTANNSFEDIKNIRRRAYYELMSSIEYLQDEGLYGTWSQSGLTAWLRKSQYQDLEVKDGKLPKNLIKVPNESTPGFRRYNKALQEFRIANKAFMLNMDPVTLSRDAGNAAFGQGLANGFGFNDLQTNDEMARAYVTLVKEHGGQLNPEYEKRVEQGTSDYIREAGGLTSFMVEFGLTKKLLKTPLKGYDQMVKGYTTNMNNRFLKFTTTAGAMGMREMAIGAVYDKAKKQLVMDHQEFGNDMWFMMGAGGYMGGMFVNGITGLTKTSTKGAQGFQKRLIQTRNAAARVSQAAVGGPLRKYAVETGLGVTASTATMIGSEIIANKLNNDRTWGEAIDEVLFMTDPYLSPGDEGYGEQLPWYHKVLHTGSMMLFGHFSNAKPFKDLSSALKSTAKNYRPSRTINRDYEYLATSEKEVSKSINEGTDQALALDLKRNKIANLRMEKYGTADPSAGPITKAELAKIDKSIENIMEANWMSQFKQVMKAIEFQETTDRNFDKQFFLLQQRLENNIQQGKKMSFEDAQLLGELPPAYKDYLGHLLASNPNMQGSNAQSLTRILDNSSKVMNQVRDFTTEYVYNDPQTFKKVYNKYSDFLETNNKIEVTQEKLREAERSNNLLERDYLQKELEKQEAKSEKLYNEINEISSGQEKQVKDLKVAIEAATATGKLALPLSDVEYRQRLKELGIEPEGSNAAFFETETEIFINQERSLLSGNIFSGTHEIPHALFDYKTKGKILSDFNHLPEGQREKALEKHNEEVLRIAEEFEKAMEPEEFAEIQRIIDQAYRFEDKAVAEKRENKEEYFITDSEGQVIYKNGKAEYRKQHYVHEYAPQLKDIIQGKVVDISPSTTKKLKNFFTDALRSMVPKAEIKEGKQLYDFIRRFASAAERGKVSKEFKKVAAQSIKEKEAVKPTEEVSLSKDIMSDQVREIQDKAIAKTKEWKAAEGEKKAELLAELKEINAEKQEVIQAENKATEEFNAKERDKLVKKFGKDKGNRLADQNEIVNELVEGGRDVDGNYKMTKEQWNNTGIKKAYEALNKGKLDPLFKGDLTGDNVFGKSFEEFNAEMRDKITNELIKFNPEKNNSLIGYLNPLIKFRRGDVIKEFKKTEFTKSLDVAAGEAGAVKEAGAESGVEARIDAEARQKVVKSTAKKVVNLSGEKQAEIMDAVADIVKEQLPNIKKGDYTFFQRKRKGEKPGPRFTEVVQEKLKKDILENIPKSGGAGKIKPEYRKFLEDKLAPELLKINKENPELLRNRKWDIFYEEVGKYTFAEAKKAPARERITDIASQRAKYKQKNPTPREIADYLTTKGRPNEMRLAVGKLLAEKIAKDALSTALVESKRLTEVEKMLIEGESAINKIADKIGVDPTVSFSKEIALSKTKNFSELVKGVENQRENLGKIVSKIKTLKNSEENLKIYTENVYEFMHALSNDVAPIETLTNKLFGEKGIQKGILDLINKEWSKVIKQAPILKEGLKKVTAEDLQRYLENSYIEQTFKEGNTSELLGNTETDMFNSKERVYSFTNSLIKLNRNRYENYKNNYDFVQDILQRYKNGLAGNARLGNASLNWVDGLLVATGIKKSSSRDGIFYNQQQLLDVLVKPILGEKVFNESVKIERGPKGDIKSVTVDGKKVETKSFAQSSQATKKFLKNFEGQSIKEGAKLNDKLKQDLKLSKEYADLNKEIIIEDVSGLKELLDKGEVDIRDIDIYMKTLVSNMNSPLRAAYHVDSFIPGKSKNYKDYVYEHNPPVRTIQVELARFVKGEITEAQLRDIFKDTSASIIPETVDKIINLRYQESKPLEYTSRWDRYLNEFTYGMFKEPIITFENGKVKKIGEYQANAYAEVQKAIKANLEVQPSFSKDIPKNAASQTKNAEMFDKALDNARKRNQPPKKARVFDFDDTLARTNSRVIYSKPNTTGKPSPQLKAVVLAGGPGSGKSSIVKGLGLEKQGYKIVNQDISLEWAKKLVGLPEIEADYDAVQRSVRSEMGALARKIAEKKLDQYTTQGKGVILDGTGASLKATRAKIEALKDQGYDVKMVYVETSKNIALERNRARKERSLQDFIVEKTWDSVNANKAEYAKEFGEDFFKVNTDNLKPGEVPAEFVQAVNERLNATERGKLEAGGFAELGDKLAGEGAQFDFREFSKVIDGKEGPLLNVAKMINEAKGDRNMFVLTARPPEAATSIHEFLKSMGLDIPIENITGLADGAPAAKAKWMVEKAAEGYNDFYFADDHIGNVEAVGEALKGLQVKSKVQRAKPKESEKQLTEDLNKELSKEAGKDVSFSFDTKKELDWKKTKEFYRNEFNTSTKVGDQKVNIRLTEVEKGSWELDFGVGEKKFEDSIGKLGITGKGDAYRIFSVVGNGVTDLINKQGLKEINFSALEPSRARVYETFTKLWAKRLGWEFEADVHVDGSGSYTITKPNFKSKKRETILSKIRSKASFSLDTKRDLKWKQHKENDRAFISKFNIGDKKYEIILSDASGRGNVEFAFARVVGKDRVFDMIGDGNAYEVVSIVTNGLVDLIKSNRIPIKEIVFSADRPSRATVYERIAKMWANELGWNMERYEGYSETGADFAISRQEWAQKLIDQKVDRRGFEMQASDPAPKDFETIEPFTLEEQAAVREVFESQQRYREVLDQVDVKSEVQKERASFSKDVDREFNELLESSTGVEAYKEFSPAKAEVIGAKKGRRKFFIPPSAEDFLGLLYPTLGKGKTGEANMDWYNKHLFKPYSRATANLSTDRANLMTDFKALKKQLNVPKDLRKTTKSGFTNEQAVRVYLWNKTGKEIPGLSKTDLAELNKIIEKDPNLEAFANQILEITKGDGYSEPGRHWLSGTITTDLIDLLNTTKRNKYLAEWNENVKLIFSPKNLNKLEAIYGSKYREALENSLARMKAGKNRIEGGNRLSNGVLNYINQGQGAIMFTNMRSALLQTISSVNYVNWSFNNPYRAGKAFANQPQYWKDFYKLMNSDYLVDRRNGLKLNISENEIADAAKTSTNKAKAVLNYIIEKGYLPTKFADSFAIASGGATFYRNRIKDLMKKFPDMELSKAEEIAFEEFRNVSEASQQSSDPGRISQQQASDIGRVMLQFVNTPMQYARLQKRSFQDLMNNRGNKKEHISKIIYYGVAQNIWFNFFQQGAFMLGFGDNTEEEWQKREFGIVNSMLDNLLRGIGLAGMTVSVLKNTGIDIYERSQKDRPEYVDAWQELLGFSPSIKSKLQQFQGAGRIWDKNSDEIFEKGFSLDNPAWRSLAKVVQGATALPLERLFQKADNLSAAFDGEHEAWQSTAMVLGWPEWQLLSQDAKDFNYAKENPDVYSKKQQVEILEKFGLNEKQIKDLKTEDQRVEEILRLQKKNKKFYKPKTTKEQVEKQKLYYDYTKVEQTAILRKHGYSINYIKKKLKTEDQRVQAIMEAEKRNNKKYKP